MKSFATPAYNIRWLVTAVVLGVILASGLLYHYAFLGSSGSTSFPIVTHEDSKTSTDLTSIPNIVHFIHLVHPSSTPAFEFPFRQFIAIYSAWLFLNPETIYIHTNVEEHLIEEALNRTVSPYTKAVTKLPNIKFSLQIPQDHTKSGIPIDKLPNQSDFVRTIVLGGIGGIYLDDDSYVLRDLKPFRTLGYDNVLGQQVNEQICPAVILSRPHNRLMKAYHDLQDGAFDPNHWAWHATDLLTTLALEFQIPDRQVLILPHETFIPFGWFPEDLKGIYNVHDDPGKPIINNKDSQNMEEFIRNFELHKPKTWQHDWRSSYVLHGFTSGIQGQLNDAEREEMFGKFGGITLDYVLAQNSNFARAVYPAVKHALDNGYLDHIEDTTSHT